MNDYFIPKVNSTYQNHVFRSVEQREGETVAQFVTRLRQVVKDCDYGDQADNQIRDQVVQRCTSHDLRRKLLEKGDKLTLDVLLKTAASYEAVQAQLESMKSKNINVNRVRDSGENKHHKGKKISGEPGNKTCYRCGYTDETLNAPLKEKLARHVVVLIILLRNAKQSLANLEVIRSQKRRGR